MRDAYANTGPNLHANAGIDPDTFAWSGSNGLLTYRDCHHRGK